MDYLPRVWFFSVITYSIIVSIGMALIKPEPFDFAFITEIATLLLALVLCCFIGFIPTMLFLWITFKEALKSKMTTKLIKLLLSLLALFGIISTFFVFIYNYELTSNTPFTPYLLAVPLSYAFVMIIFIYKLEIIKTEHNS